MFGIDYDYEDTPRFEEEMRQLNASINEELENRIKNKPEKEKEE